MRPQSGLQREVLDLYKRALRIARTKPVETRAKFDILIRYTFRTQATSVSPRQIGAIEHLLRKFKRQLETYEAPLVKDCYVSREMKEWNRAFRRTQDSLSPTIQA